MRSSLVALMLLAGTAQAGEKYGRNLLPGGRAAGFAGAFVAIADDPSATWVNPAGLAQQRHLTLSLSTHVYAADRVTVADGERKLGRVGDEQNTQFWVAPAASGVAKALNGPDADMPQTWGFVVHQTDVERADRRVLLDGATIGGVLETDRLAALLTEDTRTSVFGYGIGLTPRVSLGASLIAFQHSNTSRAILELSRDLPGLETGFTSQLTRLEYSVVSAAAVVGALYRPTDAVSMGLAPRSPTVSVLGSGATQQETARFGTTVDGGNTLVAADESDLTARHKMPLSVSAGVAWRLGPALQLAAQVNVDAPVSAYDPVDSKRFAAGALAVEKALVVDAALGAELRLSEVLLLRGGALSQRSNVDAVAADQIGATDPGDRYGGTLALGIRTGRVGVDVGALYLRAAGHAVVAGPEGEHLTERRLDRLQVFLGATYWLDDTGEGSP
jgi:hypothetical protein